MGQTIERNWNEINYHLSSAYCKPLTVPGTFYLSFHFYPLFKNVSIFISILYVGKVKYLYKFRLNLVANEKSLPVAKLGSSLTVTLKEEE